MDMPGHNADLDFVGGDNAWAIRAHEPGPLALHLGLGADHVAHREALGDANHQVEVRFHRLADRLSGERRRNVDDRHRRPGLLLRLLHRGEDRNALEGLAGLFRIDARDVAVSAVGVFLPHPGVELAGLSGDALSHHPGVPVDEDGHQRFPRDAATTFWPASAMLLPEMIGSPDSARIFLPRSTLVPSRRTTSGTRRLTCFAAATTP